MFEFTQSHPGWTFAIISVVCGTVTAIAHALHKMYRIRVRGKNIAAHGWPQPGLNADRDFEPYYNKLEYWRDIDQLVLKESEIGKQGA